MDIKVLPVGFLQTNCYVVSCPITKEGIVIDPGDECERIINVLQNSELKIKYIVNTHGHHDHVGCNKQLKDFLKCDLLIHEDDENLLVNAKLNLANFLGVDNDSPAPDKLLKEKDFINFGNEKLEVIHTPGHTPGGICLYSTRKKVCFTGDTLFYGSIGRTDLPGGSYKTLLKSLKEKVIKLPDEVVVYPGHGPESSIGKEKVINPFLK